MARVVLSAARWGVVSPVADRSCGRARSRSLDGVAPPSARPGDQPSGCGCRPRQPLDNPAREGGAQARGASCSDRQMQRLAFAPIVGVSRLRREHEPQRVDDVGPCLIPRSALAEDTGDLRDRRDYPAFLAGFVDDRQIKLFGHTADDIAPLRVSPVEWVEPIPPTPAFAGFPNAPGAIRTRDLSLRRRTRRTGGIPHQHWDSARFDTQDGTPKTRDLRAITGGSGQPLAKTRGPDAIEHAARRLVQSPRARPCCSSTSTRLSTSPCGP